jgi:hypothetical protein
MAVLAGQFESLSIIRRHHEGDHRSTLRFESETDRQIAIWVHLAYTKALNLFATEER